MYLEYQILLSGLLSKRDLWVTKTAPIIEEQLRRQGRTSANFYRYEVHLEIVEGKRRPASDVDNYAKKTIDAVTRTRLLWQDDKQIDLLTVQRKRQPRDSSSQVELRIKRVGGQHSGAPTFFRARCREARLGHPHTYADAGYHLAIHIWSQQPYDLEDDRWLRRLKSCAVSSKVRMTKRHGTGSGSIFQSA